MLDRFDKISEFIDSLKKLEKNEILYIFNELLKDKNISFSDLAQIYIVYLEDKKKKDIINIAGLAIPLTSYWSDDFKKSNKRQQGFIRAKAAYNLIKSGLYKGTPFEKNLREVVDEYEYKEDEYGHHNMIDKK